MSQRRVSHCEIDIMTSLNQRSDDLFVAVCTCYPCCVCNYTFDQQFNIMAQPRRPLGEISGNIPKRRELTPYERGQIIGAAKCGVKPSAICIELSLSRCTVRTTINSKPLRKNGESQPRSGRPRTYSERDERLLLRVVRQFPKCTYAQLRAFTGLKLCNFTL